MEVTKQYQVDVDAVKETFRFTTTGLQHKQAVNYKMLPFVANETKLVSEFAGVTGAFSRMVAQKELKEDFDVNLFLENAADQVDDYDEENNKEAQNRNAFKSIVRTLFLDEDKLVHFDVKTLNYVAANSSEEKVALFLFSSMIDEKSLEAARQTYEKPVDNMLYKIVLEALPKLRDKTYRVGEYVCYLPYVKELFQKDFQLLLSNEDFYKQSLSHFLEFYYMFYLSQLIMKLNRFENADLTAQEPLYFTLDWEKTAKTRMAYQYGWEKLKPLTETFFTHAVVLEMLNHDGSGIPKGYLELKQILDAQETFQNTVDELLKLYTEQIGKMDSKDYKNSLHGKVDFEAITDGFSRVKDLYETVRYQFENSTRSRANDSFRNWFIKFYQANFAKRRGQLGYNLNITEDDIIFLTKLCVGTEDKIKLKDLFVEMEKRGVYFDKYSQEKIEILYEKLNLLEKKSDSGDAKYVKSIL